MTDPTQLPDEWIRVWFTDNGTTCIHDTEENRQMLDAVLQSASGGSVDLVCLNGAPMKVRRNYIGGYVRSGPADRIISRAFERARNRENKSEAWMEGDDE